jgi:hypothetical protein
LGFFVSSFFFFWLPTVSKTNWNDCWRESSRERERGVVGFSSLNAFYWKSLTDVRGRLEYGNSRWQEEEGESKFDVRSSFTKETHHIRHEIIQKKNQRTICYICIRPSSLYLPRHKNNKNRYTREKFECGNWKNKKKIKIKTDEKITDGRKLHYFFPREVAGDGSRRLPADDYSRNISTVSAIGFSYICASFSTRVLFCKKGKKKKSPIFLCV